MELDRLSQMITELLELSRAGERDAAGELLALDDVARRAAQRWQRAAVDRGQRVVVAGADGVRPGSPARTPIGSSMRSSRALLYSPSGDVEIATDGASLAVSDHGAGLAPARRTRS